MSPNGKDLFKEQFRIARPVILIPCQIKEITALRTFDCSRLARCNRNTSPDLEHEVDKIPIRCHREGEQNQSPHHRPNLQKSYLEYLP